MVHTRIAFQYYHNNSFDLHPSLFLTRMTTYMIDSHGNDGISQRAHYLQYVEPGFHKPRWHRQFYAQGYKIFLHVTDSAVQGQPLPLPLPLLEPPLPLPLSPLPPWSPLCWPPIPPLPPRPDCWLCCCRCCCSLTMSIISSGTRRYLIWIYQVR